MQDRHARVRVDSWPTRRKFVNSSSLTFLRILTAHSCTCRRMALYTCEHRRTDSAPIAAIAQTEKMWRDSALVPRIANPVVKAVSICFAVSLRLVCKAETHSSKGTLAQQEIATV